MTVSPGDLDALVPHQPSGPPVGADHARCPSCGASQIGEPVPEDKRELYGNQAHFWRNTLVLNSTDSSVFSVRADCHHGWVQQGTMGRPENASDVLVVEHNKNVALMVDRDHVQDTITEHAEALSIMLGLLGYQWLAWAVDERVGSSLRVLVEDTGLTSAGSRNTIETARALVAEALGLPASIVSGDRGRALITTWHQVPTSG